LSEREFLNVLGELRELEWTIEMIKWAVENRTLSETEARGFIEIIGRYAKRVDVPAD